MTALAAIAAVAVLSFGISTFDSIDSHGWIAHNRTTTITVESTWMIGETRRCASPGNSAFVGVQCDDGPERTFEVTFYGRERQPEYLSVHWNCKRNADRFTCRELSGTPIQ